MSFGVAWTLTWVAIMAVFTAIGLWLEKRAQKRREQMERMFYFGVACERARANRIRRNREEIVNTLKNV